MTFKTIHQFLPVFAKYDAIGKTVSEIQNFLIKQGYESKIFVEKPIPQTSQTTTIYTEYKPQDTDLLIYHHSIGSSLAAYMEKINIPKIMFYHNITPPRFFENYDKSIASELFHGIEQTKQLAKSFKFAMAASGYNKYDLHRYGYRYVLDAQYFIDLERFDSMQLDDRIAQLYKNSTNILFVGRRVPNKKAEDLLKVFAYYKLLNPKSKLFLLGGSWSIEKYINKLQDLQSKLHLNKDDVIILDILSDEELQSYYKIADVFLCMSEHEGFCIPIVESMYFQKPIIAYNSSAIPDTLGGSGILVNHKKYDEIAQIIHLIQTNNILKNKIISKQNKRLMFFKNIKPSDILEKNIEFVSLNS